MAGRGPVSHHSQLSHHRVLNKSRMYSWSFVILLLLPINEGAPERRTGVTHEDIRDAIISLVHLLQTTTQKLERHEMRERQLGDQLKKAIGGLDSKGRAQDTAIANMAAVLNRIDDRVNKIEIRLQEQDERQKGSYTIDTVPLQSWMSNVEGMLNKQAPPTELMLSKDQLEKMESIVNSKIDSLTSAVERLEAQSIQSKSQLPTAAVIDGLYQKTDNQFATQEKWHQIILSELEGLKKVSAETVISKPQGDNYTMEELAKIKYSLEYLSSDRLMNIDVKLQEINRGLEDFHKVRSNLKELKDSIDESFADVRVSQNEISNDVQSLTKVEQVLIQTADNVLDTRRRVEYGVQEILLGVGEMVKSQAKELNDTVNNRFNGISQTILENQNGGLSNLSSKIEMEISQVWRQIGIMYKQLTDSASTLDKLQRQTEQYVNGSLSTMDSMDGRVGEITGRVSDVKENLNYLMGRLMLVTQEFNQTKGDLATAFENLRSTFKTVRQEAKDLGPGPNPIEDQDDNRL